MDDSRIYVNGSPLPISTEELAGRLDPTTLESISRGIPVSFDQALAAIAHQSLRPKRKKKWYHRIARWFTHRKYVV